jgi:ABC-2 type transport system permease protein
VVTALAIPCHLYFVGQADSGLGSGIIGRSQFTFWVSVAGAASLVIGAIATIVPLRIGIRAFQRIEF